MCSEGPKCLNQLITADREQESTVLFVGAADSVFTLSNSLLKRRNLTCGSFSSGMHHLRTPPLLFSTCLCSVCECAHTFSLIPLIVCQTASQFNSVFIFCAACSLSSLPPSFPSTFSCLILLLPANIDPPNYFSRSSASPWRLAPRHDKPPQPSALVKSAHVIGWRLLG